MPNLKEIYLVNDLIKGDNKIKTIQGMEGLTSLQILNLRKNLIENFDENFPAMESLRYLNFR
jgi:Leucine-rich repeat (LRR) protein